MANRPEYITVGRFGRPRDVFGEIYVTPATDDPTRILELKQIFVIREDQRLKMNIESARMIGGKPVAKIEGINSREEAARLTNLSIEIPLAEARKLPEGRYYQFDLVGCRVKGSDGTDYGEVMEVFFYPANDVYKVKSDRFGEVLLPAVDQFIIRVDLDKKEIIVDPPAGLFEPDEN